MTKRTNFVAHIVTFLALQIICAVCRTGRAIFVLKMFRQIMLQLQVSSRLIFVGPHQLRHPIAAHPHKRMLFMRLGQCFGGFSVQAQDQHAGLAGPAVAGVLADAVHKRQPALAQLSFERVLAGFVFCVGQRLAPWVPCGDERGALGLVLRHQAHELWAGLADAHGERGGAVHDVVGFLEGLQQFGRWGGHGGAGSELCGLCVPAAVLCTPLGGVFVQLAQ